MDETSGFIFYHVTDYNICNIINMTCIWNSTFNNRTREIITKFFKLQATKFRGMRITIPEKCV